MAEPPVAKRVRFAMTADANDATRLAIATDTTQVEDGVVEFFAPAFTYHAFGKEEQVEGYEGLKIEIVFNGYDFSALVDITYKEQDTKSDNLIEKLTPSLPERFTQDKEQFAKELELAAAKEFSPPGPVVSSYTQEIDGVERSFDIYECALDKNDAAQALHRNMQTMALWFIEGADGIDVTDPRWVVYITYERVRRGEGTDSRLRPVGFVTLFKFFNPLARKKTKASATETHRICQALIFPTHQRQGHCERIVAVIYSKIQADDNVYEVTVEDPVPGFSKLRDIVDAKQCMKAGFFSISPSSSAGVPAGHGTASLLPADIEAVQDKLKLTQRQVQRCYELFKLGYIDQSKEDEYKPYRLEVKKRLLKLHAEDVEGMGSERRKAFLETEYRQLEAIYLDVLSKARLQK